MTRSPSSRLARLLLAAFALLILLPAGCVAAGAAPTDSAQFDALFTGRTMRWDYHHCGTAGQEHIARDAFRLEGDWPGSRVHLIDETDLGLYLFEVVDDATGRVIYSRGFCSIFGEWETTGEALDGAWRSFHESQRFPEPRGKASLILKKRAADQAFRTIHTEGLDPEGRNVDRSAVPAAGETWTVLHHGPPSRKLDLLILGDGYAADEIEKFHADVQRLTDALFSAEPFLARKGDFNVRAIDLPAAKSGVTDARRDIWRNSPLGLHYNAFDSARYVLTYENKALREIAAQAPYDALAVIFNDHKYGGGGIFNLWALTAADAPPAADVFVHELGHSLAGLADEYYSTDVAYEALPPLDVEPWEPNVTALLDPAELKWGDLVEPGTPIPTPWGPGAADEAVRFADCVGAFEGASYRADGLYRPTMDCLMLSFREREFCPVCQEAIERVIDMQTE